MSELTEKHYKHITFLIGGDIENLSVQEWKDRFYASVLAAIKQLGTDDVIITKALDRDCYGRETVVVFRRDWKS